MTKGPTLEIHLVPIFRVRGSYGQLLPNRWQLKRWAIDKYIWEWRYLSYKKCGEWPTEEEVDAMRAEVEDRLGDAMTDLPLERVKKVVCAAQEDVL